MTDMISKRNDAKDGDGDGLVFDGTPKQRPATPAEIEAGAKALPLKQRAGYGLVEPGKAPADLSPVASERAENVYERLVAGESLGNRDDYFDALTKVTSANRVNEVVARADKDKGITPREKAAVRLAGANRNAEIGGRKGKPIPAETLAQPKSDEPNPEGKDFREMSPAEKVKTAEIMYGTGSKQHEAAKKKYGTDEPADEAAPGAPESLTVELSSDGRAVLDLGGKRDADDPLLAAAKSSGFKWAPSQKAWVQPRNLKPETVQRNLAAFAEKAKAAGVEVSISDDIPTETAEVTPESLRERAARSRERSAALRSKAERKSGDVERLSAERDAQTENIPFGQPILVGHSSEGKHRAALKRFNAKDDKVRQAYGEQKEAERKATTAEANASLLERRAKEMEEGTQYGPQNVKPGDLVTINGQPRPVIRANAKSVTVAFSLSDTYHKTQAVPWEKVRGHVDFDDLSDQAAQDATNNKHPQFAKIAAQRLANRPATSTDAPAAETPAADGPSKDDAGFTVYDADEPDGFRRVDLADLNEGDLISVKGDPHVFVGAKGDNALVRKVRGTKPFELLPLDDEGGFIRFNSSNPKATRKTPQPRRFTQTGFSDVEPGDLKVGDWVLMNGKRYKVTKEPYTDSDGDKVLNAVAQGGRTDRTFYAKGTFTRLDGTVTGGETDSRDIAPAEVDETPEAPATEQAAPSKADFLARMDAAKSNDERLAIYRESEDAGLDALDRLEIAQRADALNDPEPEPIVFPDEDADNAIKAAGFELVGQDRDEYLYTGKNADGEIITARARIFDSNALIHFDLPEGSTASQVSTVQMPLHSLGKGGVTLRNAITGAVKNADKWTKDKREYEKAYQQTIASLPGGDSPLGFPDTDTEQSAIDTFAQYLRDLSEAVDTTPPDQPLPLHVQQGAFQRPSLFTAADIKPGDTIAVSQYPYPLKTATVDTVDASGVGYTLPDGTKGSSDFDLVEAVSRGDETWTKRERERAMKEPANAIVLEEERKAKEAPAAPAQSKRPASLPAKKTQPEADGPVPIAEARLTNDPASLDPSLDGYERRPVKGAVINEVGRIIPAGDRESIFHTDASDEVLKQAGIDRATWNKLAELHKQHGEDLGAQLSAKKPYILLNPPQQVPLKAAALVAGKDFKKGDTLTFGGRDVTVTSTGKYYTKATDANGKQVLVPNHQIAAVNGADTAERRRIFQDYIDMPASQRLIGAGADATLKKAQESFGDRWEIEQGANFGNFSVTGTAKSGDFAGMKVTFHESMNGDRDLLVNGREVSLEDNYGRAWDEIDGNIEDFLRTKGYGVDRSDDQPAEGDTFVSEVPQDFYPLDSVSPSGSTEPGDFVFEAEDGSPVPADAVEGIARAEFGDLSGNDLAAKFRELLSAAENRKQINAIEDALPRGNDRLSTRLRNTLSSEATDRQLAIENGDTKPAAAVETDDQKAARRASLDYLDNVPDAEGISDGFDKETIRGLYEGKTPRQRAAAARKLVEQAQSQADLNQINRTLPRDFGSAARKSLDARIAKREFEIVAANKRAQAEAEATDASAVTAQSFEDALVERLLDPDTLDFEGGLNILDRYRAYLDEYGDDADEEFETDAFAFVEGPRNALRSDLGVRDRSDLGPLVANSADATVDEVDQAAARVARRVIETARERGLLDNDQQTDTTPETPAAPEAPEPLDVPDEVLEAVADDEEYLPEFYPPGNERSAKDGKKNAAIDAREARDAQRRAEWNDGVEEADPTISETVGNLSTLMGGRKPAPAATEQPVDATPEIDVPDEELEAIADGFDADSLATTVEPLELDDSPNAADFEDFGFDADSLATTAEPLDVDDSPNAADFEEFGFEDSLANTYEPAEEITPEPVDVQAEADAAAARSAAARAALSAASIEALESARSAPRPVAPAPPREQFSAPVGGPVEDPVARTVDVLRELVAESIAAARAQRDADLSARPQAPTRRQSRPAPRLSPRLQARRTNDDPTGMYGPEDVTYLQEVIRQLQARRTAVRRRNRFDGIVWRRQQRKVRESLDLYRIELARVKAEQRQNEIEERRQARRLEAEDRRLALQAEADERRMQRQIEADERREARARADEDAREQRAQRQITERRDGLRDFLNAWADRIPADVLEALIGSIDSMNAAEIARAKSDVMREYLGRSKRAAA